ncbi:crossover junction endodeoxyribonuclease RuvC [Pedomonas sp. V897]|uniref:crossover junction endodeoxyribonuclease RuvC n=1 Tax=Pedomonas sp. V897 TaxID=3446482 RepID=UPI003EE31E8D
MARARRLIGLDPGLARTGWGIIDVDGLRLTHVANGVVSTDRVDDLAERLVALHQGLLAVLSEWRPDGAAVEETFVNKNPTSTLKLGQARGVVLMTASLFGLPVAEYTPNHVKKAVVGVGHAAKEQVDAMVQRLLPGVKIAGPDASDALAVAIAHSYAAGAQAVLAKARRMV